MVAGARRRSALPHARIRRGRADSPRAEGRAREPHLLHRPAAARPAGREEERQRLALMFVLARALTWSALFIGVLLVWLPGTLLAESTPPAMGWPQPGGVAMPMCGEAVTLSCVPR